MSHLKPTSISMKQNLTGTGNGILVITIMIDKNPHHGSYCAATGQLSLRVRHQESPPATRSMNPGYFHEKQKKNRTKRSSYLRFNSPPSHRPFPHSCIYKSTNSRLGWTKSSDLYEIVYRALSSFLYVFL